MKSKRLSWYEYLWRKLIQKLLAFHIRTWRGKRCPDVLLKGDDKEYPYLECCICRAWTDYDNLFKGIEDED